MKFISKTIGEYLLKYPDINFRIAETPFIDEKRNHIDFYIRASVTYRGFIEPDSSLVRKIIFSYPLVLCCSPEYILNYSEHSAPEE